MSQITQVISAKIANIRRASAIPEWRFCVGAPEGAQSPDFDDSGWESVTLSHTWSTLDGEAWFRTRLDPPTEVEGISLAGSRLELDLFLVTGATVYINGNATYYEPSWTDTRAVPLLLEESYVPGKPITLAIRCKQGDGFGLFIGAGLYFQRLADVIFDLDLVKSQLTFTQYLAAQTPELTYGLAVWDQAVAEINQDALTQSRWDEWHESVESARKTLSIFEGEAKTYTCNLLSHSHIDMNWLWPTRETIEVCRRDFQTMDKLMEEYPEYHFSQSQAATYQFMETNYPEIFEKIQRRVKDGRWEITANTWVEGDLNLAAGETLVRQILHARRYINSRFGLKPQVCWEPDTFGHPATLPQILKKSGIPFYYFCRAGKRHPLFWWEGLDGSRVLAVQDPLGYGGNNNPSQIVDCIKDFNLRYGIRDGLFVYGAGDHGGGGTVRDIRAAQAINAAPLMPHALPGTATAFFQKVLSQNPDLPVVKAELNTIFEGCYTSHADIKRMNRAGENNLLSAESIAALSMVLSGSKPPRDILEQLWRTLCFHQFHDILCGCAIGVTYREARERLEEVFKISSEITKSSIYALVQRMDTLCGVEQDQEFRIVIVNPLAWERTEVVHLAINQLNGKVPESLIDNDGNYIPVQVCGGELIFVAKNIPALGACVYRFCDQSLSDSDQAIHSDEYGYVLDNGLIRLRVHPASGAIDQMIDLRNGRDLAGPVGGWGPEAKVNAGMINRLQILWEQPHPMSAWNLGDITRIDHLITGAEVKLIEIGAVRGVIEVRRKFLNSTMVQRVILYRSLVRVDFETEIDWHERGNAHQDAPMLRATFTPYFGYSKATFEVPFAGLQRPADGREVPALRWADLTEYTDEIGEEYGISLLNDCKYGHQVQGNTMGLTLVRASYEPDNNPDEGLHKFTYSLVPHPGDWKEAGTMHLAAELNQPVLVTVSSPHPGPLSPGVPWLQIDAKNVIVSAVKPSEDQPGSEYEVIVRMYEMFGQAAEVKLDLFWQITRAEEVSPIEEFLRDLTISGSSVVVMFEPYEIKTIKLYGQEM